MRTYILPALVALTITIAGCEKERTIDYKDLLGKWVSADLTDTIDFASDNDLYKSFSGFRDHFDYSLKPDSITIKYNGVLYILTRPATYFCKLDGDELTIDFRPQCYGFRTERIKFNRTFLLETFRK